jgi:hypothetical protein
MPKDSFLIEISERLGDNGDWIVTSPHLPGLLLGGNDLNALRSDLPLAVKGLFRLNYHIDVEVRAAAAA